MTLEELLKAWKEDSKIDATDLNGESERIYILHSKYLELWSMERIKAKGLELQIKKLRLDKNEFYVQGPSKESREKGWDYPVSGKILRTEVPLYLDADSNLQNMMKQHEVALTKVDALKYILEAIKGRGYVIHSMKEWNKYTGGS